MTEQRFTVSRDENNKSNGVYDNITQRRVYRWGCITRLLNSFNNRYIRRVSELKEENEKLKIDLDIAEDVHKLDREIIDDIHNEYKRIRAENEQLKSELEKSKKAHSRCDKLWWELHDEKEQLEKENEQLKKENKELQGKYDKQLWVYNGLGCEYDWLKEENEQLKQALLFFVDVANGEFSSNWQEDMEKDCQKLFNCSYKEAKEKYGNYNGDWWELE